MTYIGENYDILYGAGSLVDMGEGGEDRRELQRKNVA
jgi:hypothetical protein